MANLRHSLLNYSLGLMPALTLSVPHGGSIAAMTIFVFSLLVIIQEKTISFRLNKHEKILIFALILLPSIIASDVLIRDLRFRYFDFFLRFILVIPVFFAIKQIKVSIYPLVHGIIIGAVLTGLTAIYQYVTSDVLYNERVFGDAFNVHGYVMKVSYGNISLLLGVMSLAVFFLIKDMYCKKTYGLISILAFFFGLLASVLSGSRGGWVALPVFVALLFVYVPIRVMYKMIVSLVLVGIILMAYFSSTYIQNRVDLAYQTVSYYVSGKKQEGPYSSSGLRIEMWKVAYITFKENSTFGVGSGNFKKAMRQKVSSGDIGNTQQLFEHAHSEPLHFLAITGIVGAVGYLMLYGGIAYFFFVSLSRSTRSEIRYLSFLGIILIVGYFIFGLTMYAFGHLVSVLFLAVMTVIFAGLIGNIEQRQL